MGYGAGRPISVSRTPEMQLGGYDSSGRASLRNATSGAILVVVLQKSFGSEAALEDVGMIGGAAGRGCGGNVLLGREAKLG